MMNRHIKAGLSAVLLSGSAPAVADSCIYGDELAADQVRYVQAFLNVAALSCRSADHAAMQGLYNNFILRNRAGLVKSRMPLEQYLARAGVNIDKYMTRTFNRMSLASMGLEDFCGKALDIALKAGAGAGPEELIGQLPIVYAEPARRCETQMQMAVSETEAGATARP